VGRVRRTLSVSGAIVRATLLVGTIDALDAVVFFGLRGAAPMRIFQGIAAGAIGRDAARAGGWGSAALGLFFHYVVAFGIATTYVLASRAAPLLARRPLLCGPIFGIGAYFFMNLVVIPLSRIGPQPFTTGPFINGVLIHAFGIGIPIALIASRCYAGSPSGS
jgi:hypothetical protein